MSKNLVIIPTYNEKENIEKMIETVFNLSVPFDLLIVDDGSPDGTGDIVEARQKTWPGRLHLIRRPGKQGLGTAYIRGFKWGLTHNYAHIFEMDCDFSHDPNDLVRLHETLTRGGADVAVGSRYVPGGKLVNWPLSRILISRGASLYVQLFTFMPVKDATAGFVGYRRQVLETINLDLIKFVGYAFQVEMKFAAWQLGFLIKEIPITFTERVLGVSKMSSGIVKEAAFGVLKMRLASFFRTYRRPK
ncbi:MAG: polyprenol monophosphomannose synthase [Bacteroidetes bacterium]|nr:MAG: polyprenol monophosphomannose synthase [Bacteroidota bacterium]